jgi:hypothetical protein
MELAPRFQVFLETSVEARLEYSNYPASHRLYLCQQFPISGPERSTEEPIHKRNVLGGIIHDYYRQPSDPVASSG